MTNVQNHSHNGVDSPRLTPNAVKGFFRSSGSAPTGVPKNFLEQIVFYNDGMGTRLLYFYDFDGGAWRPFDYSP